MARKSPAFSFYPDSWIGGTSLMTFEQRGIYIHLLANCWLHGCLTRDQAKALCANAEPSSVDAVLDAKFTETESGFINERIEEERTKQGKRSEAGRKGGNKKQANKVASGKQNGSKSVSKPPSKNLGSVSDSDSVSIPASVSASVSEKNKSPTDFVALGDGIPSADDFFMRWNDFVKDKPKLKKVIKLSSKRRKSLNTRLREPEWFVTFKVAVEVLPLMGDGWQPDFDWFIKNDSNVYMILEGKYDWRMDRAQQKLSEQRRRNATRTREKRLEHEKKIHKQNASGTRKAMQDTLNLGNGSKSETGESSLLFG